MSTPAKWEAFPRGDGWAVNEVGPHGSYIRVIADGLLEEEAREIVVARRQCELRDEITEYLRNSEVDAWTTILNLVREHPDEAHYQSVNYIHAMRHYAEKLQGKRP